MSSHEFMGFFCGPMCLSEKIGVARGSLNITRVPGWLSSALDIRFGWLNHMSFFAGQNREFGGDCMFFFPIGVRFKFDPSPFFQILTKLLQPTFRWQAKPACGVAGCGGHAVRLGVMVGHSFRAEEPSPNGWEMDQWRLKIFFSQIQTLEAAVDGWKMSRTQLDGRICCYVTILKGKLWHWMEKYVDILRLEDIILLPSEEYVEP